MDYHAKIVLISVELVQFQEYAMIVLILMLDPIKLELNVSYAIFQIVFDVMKIINVLLARLDLFLIMMVLDVFHLQDAHQTVKLVILMENVSNV